MDEVNGGRESDTEDSEDDLPEIDLSSGNKDTSVLEVILAFLQGESWIRHLAGPIDTGHHSLLSREFSFSRSHNLTTILYPIRLL